MQIERIMSLLSEPQEPYIKIKCKLFDDEWNSSSVLSGSDDPWDSVFDGDEIYSFVTKMKFDNDCLIPERVVFNGPATIAFWPDGSKTVVKCQDGEPFDPEKGIAMVILKKIYGGGKYNDVLRKLIEEASTCNEQKKS